MDPTCWAVHEFGQTRLGDPRRTARLVATAAALAAQPAASIPEACGPGALLKGAYRFFEQERLTPDALLAGHVQETVHRAAALPLVLAVQDTTDLDYSSHRATSGLGTIGNGYGRGLMLHTTLAVAPSGTPLGLLAQHRWSRPLEQAGHRYRRKELAIADKESSKWLAGLAALTALAATCPQTQWVCVADREADVYAVFCAARAPNLALLIRAKSDRLLRPTADDPRPKLRATLGAVPVAGTLTVPVPRRPRHPARVATCTLRWTTVAPVPPRQHPGGGITPQTLAAIWVQEPDPPPGETALDWLLLTSLPLPDLAAATTVVGYYTRRFVIEHWHRTLKTGCAVEARQLQSAAALARAVALYSVIAWRILYARHLAQETPDAPCTVLLRTAEWQALACVHHRTSQVPTEPPSLAEAVRWLADLGGYLGRRSDAPPGPTVLWRGFQHLHDLTTMFLLLTHQHLPPPPP